MTQETLLSIGEASQFLGVSETTLRQWTDECKVKAFVTPGGHRRYARSELRKLLGSHSKMLGIKDLVSEIEETSKIHREIARTAFPTHSWYDRLNEESRMQLSELGRSLLNIIVKYITEPSRRETNISAARDIGKDYGQTLASLNLSLTEAVGAFIAHKDPIMTATTQLMQKREAFAGKVVQAIPQVTRVMDEVLVQLVAHHQEYQHAMNTEKEGESV